MSFYLYLAAGFVAGVLGGMGMGGGTVLIPVLTVVLGVEQHVAQAANLVAFLPMAALSLTVHKKHGLLKTEGLWYVIIPAVLMSVAGGLLATFLAGDLLRKLFGVFLIILSLKETLALFT